MIRCAALGWLLMAALASSARADHSACRDELDRRGVAWRSAQRSGIADAVEVQGPLGGVRWQSVAGRALVIDCSLVVSLAEAGRYLLDLGIEHAVFSSAYDVRNVRGTNRRSKHSYGLAIDVHRFEGGAIGSARVDLDYEQGLGSGLDCIGEPMTAAGATLKILQCQLVRSGLFHLVLSPDYDDAHHDHFHLEVRPWRERDTLRAATPAIH